MLYERHETMTRKRHIPVIVVAKNFFHLSRSVRIFENSWMTRADTFWTWAVTIFEKFCVARFAALNRARTSLIRDALWFAFESKSKLPIESSEKSQWWFACLWFFIRIYLDSQVNKSKMKCETNESNRINMKNQSESKWTNTIRSLGKVIKTNLNKK